MEFHFEETFERLEDILRYLILEKSLKMLLDNKGFGPTMSRRWTIERLDEAMKHE